MLTKKYPSTTRIVGIVLRSYIPNSGANLVAGKALNEGTDYTLDETGNVLWVPFEPVTAENVDDYM